METVKNGKELAEALVLQSESVKCTIYDCQCGLYNLGAEINQCTACIDKPTNPSNSTETKIQGEKKMNRDVWFEDQIAKDLHHIMALVAKDKKMWTDLGYGGESFAAEDIIGFMLKSLAERGSKIACTGKMEDMAEPENSADPLPRKEIISIQPGDVPVLIFPHTLSEEGNALAGEAMKRLFPHNDALILDGGASLEVYREQVEDGD